MIPPGFDRESRIPPGEVLLFGKFEGDPRTADWIVLHSLDIPQHLRQVEGEMDFLVLVPGLGVVCLEVKSHRSVRRSGGVWYLGQDESNRGPFKQASEAMHSVRKRLVEMDSSLASVPFISAVCFTHCRFDVSAPFEWESWQVFDQNDLAANSISELIERVLEGARTRLRTTPSAAWFNPGSQDPSPAQCERITRHLRAGFEFYESPRARRERREGELREYTSQQFDALDKMQKNQRVLFEGQAGTGKTLLAIEAVRRSLNSGDRVAFICFNRNLAQWLKRQMGESVGLWVGTLSSLMLETANVRPPANPEPDYWTTQLPNLALEAALDGPPRFDVLVVDEAQDVLRSNYLDALDPLLLGGLSGGSWRLFGDFANQAIYGATESPHDLLAARCPNLFTYCDLTENCRNPPLIAEHLALVSGAPRYKRCLRPDTGLRAETTLYSNVQEQEMALVSVLDQLREDHYPPHEIVILSRLIDGVVYRLPKTGWLSRVYDLGEDPPPGIRVGTIHSFKGLEAPVVILTDIDRVGDPESDSLIYVGMSRATERLFILAHASTADVIRKRLLGERDG